MHDEPGPAPSVAYFCEWSGLPTPDVDMDRFMVETISHRGLRVWGFRFGVGFRSFLGSTRPSSVALFVMGLNPTPQTLNAIDPKPKKINLRPHRHLWGLGIPQIESANPGTHSFRPLIRGHGLEFRVALKTPYLALFHFNPVLSSKP